MLVDDIWDLENHKQPTVNFPPRNKQPAGPYERSVSFCFPTLLSLTFGSDFITLAPTKKGHIKVSFHKCNPLRTYQPSQRRATWVVFWNNSRSKDVQKNLKNPRSNFLQNKVFWSRVFWNQPILYYFQVKRFPKQNFAPRKKLHKSLKMLLAYPFTCKFSQTKSFFWNTIIISVKGKYYSRCYMGCHNKE